MPSDLRSLLRPLAAALALAVLPVAALAQASVAFGGGDRDGEVEITADSLSVDRDSGNAVFSGEVLIVQGDLRLSADRVEVLYSSGADGARTMDRIVASGGVTLAMGTDAAEAQEAVYDPASGTLAMSGDVLVTQGQSAISGQRMTIDLDTGTGTVEGRVRTVLQSGTAP